MKQLFFRSLFTTLCMAPLFFSSHSLFAEIEETSFPEVMPIEEVVASENSADVWMDKIGYADDSYYLHRIHNDAFYHLVAYSSRGDIINLHDGSEWSIKRSGQETVLYWLSTDDIFIKPCAKCFSSYKYVLHNRTQNQAVAANLNVPPLPLGPYTLRIANIHPYEPLVLLNDNTVWSVDPNYLSRWQIGQRIIVGVNNYWRTAAMPHILINVDMSGYPYRTAAFYGYPVEN